MPVVAFEGKIVAEKETMARPRRIRQLDIKMLDDLDEDLDGSSNRFPDLPRNEPPRQLPCTLRL